MREPQHSVAERPEPDVARPVCLESGTCPVVAEPVRFDDQSVITPKEIDLERPHPDVDLGDWKQMSPAKREHAALQLTAGAVGHVARLLPDVQP